LKATPAYYPANQLGKCFHHGKLFSQPTFFLNVSTIKEENRLTVSSTKKLVYGEV
jgi:hypothetical protein